MMGKLLERAIEEVHKLPGADQEMIGAWLLAEIESERRWDEIFSHPPSEALNRMAAEALEDFRAGRTLLLNPDLLETQAEHHCDSAGARLPQHSGPLQNLLRPGTHAVILGQIAPPHGPATIEKKLRRPGHVLTADAGALVNQVVQAGDRTVAVGKNGERVARFLRQIAGLLGRVDADRDRTNTHCFEFGETFLKTP